MNQEKTFKDRTIGILLDAKVSRELLVHLGFESTTATKLHDEKLILKKRPLEYREQENKMLHSGRRTDAHKQNASELSLTTTETLSL